MSTSRTLAVLVGAAALLMGCGGDSCTSIIDPEGLWNHAALVRLDVYGADAHCGVGGVAVGADAPQSSSRFLPTDPIGFDVSPGHHTIVLTLFADAAGASPFATACTEGDFSAGSSDCLQLTLASLGDGGSLCGIGELLCPDGGVLCGPGERACASGACVPVSGCCSAADCSSPPAPATCYAVSCEQSVCTYAVPTGDVVCGSTCCRSLQGRCNGDCSLACAGGYVDCDGQPSNGCECAGNKCCASGACQVKHDDGVGQSFFDCVAQNTYDLAQASAACAAFTGDPTQCHDNATCAANGTNAVCSDGSSQACDCWVYAGSSAGRVRTSSSSSCYCDVHGNSPSWN
jgi:hypothetical protein